MISEYALDPALVARWHDPKEWALFREAFADGTGRYGSTFPRQSTKKWRHYVRAHFRKISPDATPESLSWQRLDALLEQFSKRMVERIARDADSGTWLEKVVADHHARPFDGILSTVRADSVPEVITPDMLFSERLPEAWKVRPSVAAPRTVAGFAQALAPLLMRCKEAVFVDPHFNPDEKRYLNSLEALLTVLWGSNLCTDKPETQLIMAEGTKEDEKANRDAGWLLDRCQKRLPKILPSGCSLKVTVLRRRECDMEIHDREKLHNRYVLTKLAGISFGIGLDVADDNERGQTDDLCRLSGDQLKLRWGQYVSAKDSYFDVAAGPQEISSSGHKREKR
jgi:hypothetical protein